MSPAIFFPRLLMVWLACGLLLPGRAAQTLVSTGAAWRFLDTGTNLGTGWRAADFDDSLWSSGPAQLGFGDGDESTVINGGPSNARFRTTYFRSSFVITNLGALTNFAARLLRDDGAVVRLETLLDLPLGTAWIGFTAATGYDTENHDIIDWSFAANLAPSVALTAPASGAVLVTNQVPLTATASDPGGRITRVEFVGDGTLLGARTNAPFTLAWSNVPEGAHTAFVRAVDDQGVTNRSVVVNFAVTSPPRLMDAMRLADGRFQMSFLTSTGLSYQVQYSENLLNWFNAGAPLAGTGQPQTWIDHGPPLTPTPPQTTPHRFFKVVVLPAP